MKRSFEDFLKEWHMNDYTGTDDDAPDAFEHWMSELEVGDIEPLADKFGSEMFMAGFDLGAKTALDSIKESFKVKV